MGRLAESLPHFRRAAELRPADPALQTNLGVALARSGDLKGAVAAFENALKADPDNQAARENLERARAGLTRK
jgi:Flp pilus assembly protein TadD